MLGRKLCNLCNKIGVRYALCLHLVPSLMPLSVNQHLQEATLCMRWNINSYCLSCFLCNSMIPILQTIFKRKWNCWNLQHMVKKLFLECYHNQGSYSYLYYFEFYHLYVIIFSCRKIRWLIFSICVKETKVYLYILPMLFQKWHMCIHLLIEYTNKKILVYKC